MCCDILSLDVANGDGFYGGGYDDGGYFVVNMEDSDG